MTLANLPQSGPLGVAADTVAHQAMDENRANGKMVVVVR